MHYFFYQLLPGIITGVIIAIALWVVEARASQKRQRTANTLAIRKMYLDITTSQCGKDVALKAYASLFDYIAIAWKDGKIDEKEFASWENRLVHLCLESSDEFSPDLLPDSVYSKEFAQMLDKASREARRIRENRPEEDQLGESIW